MKICVVHIIIKYCPLNIEYASTVWQPYLKKDIRRIENVQKRATKMVKNIKHLPYTKRLKELGLPTLQYRRKRADMLQVYKILSGLDDIDPCEILNTEANTRTRGHPHKLGKVRTKTKKYQNSFRHRVVDPWNALPEEAVTAETNNSFKSSLNKAWKQHPNKFSDEI